MCPSRTGTPGDPAKIEIIGFGTPLTTKPRTIFASSGVNCLIMSTNAGCAVCIVSLFIAVASNEAYISLNDSSWPVYRNASIAGPATFGEGVTIFSGGTPLSFSATLVAVNSRI
ncbi:hypothetical protein D3C80_1256370 [compost metagenome]